MEIWRTKLSICAIAQASDDFSSQVPISHSYPAVTTGTTGNPKGVEVIISQTLVIAGSH